MRTYSKHHVIHALVPGLMALLVGCAGTTSTQSSHSRIAAGAGIEHAKVYFIRPDPGFKGVMDRPVSISLEGAELLNLAKGQYTLMSLVPGPAEMKVDALTVVGPSNMLTPVSTKTPLKLNPRETHYLILELVSRGSLSGSAFVPRQVSRDRAIEAARGLVPVGMAVADPIK